jgi:3,4-dehydroadipyl-CoA semialdehyde dehydrogenase
MAGAAPVRLESYLGGRWIGGQGAPDSLVNPATGDVVALVSSEGLDLAAALDFARSVGGPALRGLSFGERARLLGAVADALAAQKDRWYEISRVNSGNTRADAMIDVDGAIGTLKYYAKLGESLGEAAFLVDGPPARLARDPNFVALHLSTPVRGVAIQINAYNFPSWGLWGKAGVAILAGVPVLAKPATATAWLAEQMVRAVIDAGVLPAGALSLLSGGARDLLDHVRFGDVIAFTGSAETGDRIRTSPKVLSAGVRVNIEADSLNSAILAPDAGPGTPAFGLFVAEVAKEMTSKAGQKCTAIRRAFVPAEHAEAATAALAQALAAIQVGDPADEGVQMGPVVSLAQRASIARGVQALKDGGAEAVDLGAGVPLAGDAERGAFVSPILMRARAGDNAASVHEIEVFGPVATVIPYNSAEELFGLVRRGGGSLATSVFANDAGFLIESAEALGESHGRLLLIDPTIGASHSGHGIVLPSCLHGGPGRAGNGSELGGLRGLAFYMQRTAVQGAADTLALLNARAAQPG